jgi:hypothetical protein
LEGRTARRFGDVSLTTASPLVFVNIPGELSFFVFASSLHDDVVNDGVSETKLCVSSKPSSFSSCEINLPEGEFDAVRNDSRMFHSRSGVGDFKLLIASRTSSWLIRLMLFPILPMRDTTSLLALFFTALLLLASFGDKSSFVDDDRVFSSLFVGTIIEKLASLIESGEVVAAFVLLVSSVALLKSIGRLNLLVRRADENLSN